MIYQVNYYNRKAQLPKTYLRKLHHIYSLSADIDGFLDELLKQIKLELRINFGMILLWDKSGPISGTAKVKIRSIGIEDRWSEELSNTLICLKTSPAPDSIVPVYDYLRSFLSRALASNQEELAEKQLLFLPVIKFDTVVGAVLLGNRHPDDLHNRDRELLHGMVLEIFRLADRLMFSQWCVGRGYNLRLIGVSDTLLKTEQLAMRFAQSTCPVLVTGETGTGKELTARSIHFYSARSEKPFVAVNCGVFASESILASELFGHVRGAFTDAKISRKGKLELADKGTLFLDEVACMSPAMQVALLRTLRYGEVHKVGDDSLTRRVDVRIVAACNDDLQQSIRRGDFREDLYSRLGIAHITIPPLRERVEDIPLLVDYFLAKISRETDGYPRTITAEALETLLNWHWPDNIAGLEGVLKRADLVSNDHVLDACDLPEKLTNTKGETIDNKEVDQAVAPQEFPPLDTAINQFERSYIIRALALNNGNVSATARMLGISRQGLQKKLSRLEIANGLNQAAGF